VSFILALVFTWGFYCLPKYNKFDSIRYGLYLSFLLGIQKEAKDIFVDNQTLLESASDILFNSLGLLAFLLVSIYFIDKYVSKEE